MFKFKHLVIIVAWCVPTLAQAASFDCSKATSKIEKLICSDPDLSRLDDEMARIFKDAVNVVLNRKGVLEDQRLWLRRRLDVCLLSDVIEPAACLGDEYQSRNNFLRKLALSKDEEESVMPTEEMRQYETISAVPDWSIFLSSNHLRFPTQKGYLQLSFVGLMPQKDNQDFEMKRFVDGASVFRVVNSAEYFAANRERGIPNGMSCTKPITYVLVKEVEPSEEISIRLLTIKNYEDFNQNSVEACWRINFQRATR